MFNNLQFREFIIRPALKVINLYSIDAEEILVGTLANESLGGTFLKQEDGPALGPYEMEPNTYDSLWSTILSSNLKLSTALLEDCQYTKKPPMEIMIFNLRYATQMARIKYLSIDHPLPAHNNLFEIWLYYKKYYNSYLGKATQEKFFSNYKKFIGTST